MSVHSVCAQDIHLLKDREADILQVGRLKVGCWRSGPDTPNSWERPGEESDLMHLSRRAKAFSRGSRISSP